jgi:hypothetical protein
MATINFTTLTIPTPEPYYNKDPQKQLENLCYVLLQLCQLAKNAGVSLNDQDLPNIKTAIQNLSFTVPATDLQGLIDAIAALQFNAETIDLGDVTITLSGKTVTLEE